MAEDPLQPAPKPPSAAVSFDAAMEALAIAHSGVIEIAWLARTLQADAADGIAPFMADLMNQGKLIATADLATTVLVLMQTRPRVQWLRPKTALQCVMKLYELGARDPDVRVAIHRAMDALAEWRNGWTDLPALDDDTRLWWGWLDELRFLGAEIPEPLRTELLAAAGAGDLAQARPSVSELTTADAGMASALRDRLLEAGPLLEEGIGFLLMPAAQRVNEVTTGDAVTVPRAAAASFARPAPGKVDLLRDNADAVVGAMTRSLGPRVTPRRIGIGAGLVVGVAILVWSIGLFHAEPEVVPLDPEQQEIVDAGADLCEYLGADTSGCVFVRQVTKGMEAEDCPTMRTAMRSVERLVRGTEGFGEFSTDEDVVMARDALEIFVERFKGLCLQE